MTAAARRAVLIAPAGTPEIRPGDDLARILLSVLARMEERLRGGDVVVLAQKVVSKAEGRTARLADVTPGAEALDLARRAGKDPRIVELILRESAEILRLRPGLIVARHRNGCVAANAGVDLSNAGAGETAILLPEDADRSARGLRSRLEAAIGAAVGVVINDSLGRAWRLGTAGTAIGASGVRPLLDRRGEPDRDGRVLRTSEIAAADEIAAAASLLMGQGGEGLPFVLLRGCPWVSGDGRASDLVRPLGQDLFR